MTKDGARPSNPYTMPCRSLLTGTRRYHNAFVDSKISTFGFKHEIAHHPLHCLSSTLCFFLSVLMTTLKTFLACFDLPRFVFCEPGSQLFLMSDVFGEFFRCSLSVICFNESRQP